MPKINILFSHPDLFFCCPPGVARPSPSAPGTRGRARGAAPIPPFAFPWLQAHQERLLGVVQSVRTLVGSVPSTVQQWANRRATPPGISLRPRPPCFFLSSLLFQNPGSRCLIYFHDLMRARLRGQPGQLVSQRPDPPPRGSLREPLHSADPTAPPHGRRPRRPLPRPGPSTSCLSRVARWPDNLCGRLQGLSACGLFFFLSECC